MPVAKCEFSDIVGFVETEERRHGLRSPAVHLSPAGQSDVGEQSRGRAYQLPKRAGGMHGSKAPTYQKGTAMDSWDMSGPEEGDTIDQTVLVTFDGDEIFEVPRAPRGLAATKDRGRRIAALLNKYECKPCQ